jgi:hypothetical protein
MICSNPSFRAVHCRPNVRELAGFAARGFLCNFAFIHLLWILCDLGYPPIKLFIPEVFTD